MDQLWVIPAARAAYRTIVGREPAGMTDDALVAWYRTWSDLPARSERHARPRSVALSIVELADLMERLAPSA